MMSTEGPGSNTGHGHVWARPDGAKARCGGSAICSECAKDAAQYKVPYLGLEITVKGRIAVNVQRAVRGEQTWEEATEEILKLVQPRPQGEPSERNTAPEEEWLTVWAYISEAIDADEADVTADTLAGAVLRLYLLLEPPSVRERRLNGGEALPELREENIEVSTWHVADQPVNQGPRGVTITHLPTGIFAQSGQHRSQLENKVTALEELRQKLARSEKEQKLRDG